MLAYGKLSRDLMAGGYSQGRLGFEFAGTLPSASPSEPPQRVMGVARQSIATSVGAPQYLVRLPPNSPHSCGLFSAVWACSCRPSAGLCLLG